jgi:hypothetical protein
MIAKTRVVVAQERTTARIRQVVVPAVRARVEILERVVESPEQPSDTRDRSVPHGPAGERRDRNLSIDEREHLAAASVDPERPRRSVEPNAFEVLERREDG